MLDVPYKALCALLFPLVSFYCQSGQTEAMRVGSEVTHRRVVGSLKHTIKHLKTSTCVLYSSVNQPKESRSADGEGLWRGDAGGLVLGAVTHRRVSASPLSRAAHALGLSCLAGLVYAKAQLFKRRRKILDMV